MQEIRTDLVKVSTYARKKGITPVWVYQLAKQGKVKIVIIDGVQFIKV